ncbi:putative non-ATPase regulatory subunit of 26S proteasome [Hamiltosporidium tvaerminnensis]|uniref:Putative non-ATPase regulatory subunit of 26S proteasome n=1 Tax=Hamiltosporidium tvaerminnensis TaxID=1176355 RepID=A0A4Q9LN09_9MICR|nr:putative non-ATPase regulatory subunit of 26S proteasome [Hamiltosporidium tvaerminnensis]
MDELLNQEREARSQNDQERMIIVYKKIMENCKSDIERIQICKLLGKRKGLIKPAFKNLISYLIEIFTNQTSSKEILIDLLEKFLSEVINGKIFLEEERICVTNLLKKTYESKKAYLSALNSILIPIETFSTVQEKSIIEYQLEQLRLSNFVQDWIKGDIIIKKIRMRYFKETNDLEMERLFYQRANDFYIGQEKFLEVSEKFRLLKNFKNELGTVNFKINFDKENYENDESRKYKMENVILSSFFCIIALYENERENFYKRREILLKSNLEDDYNLIEIKEILKIFLSSDIITYENLKNIFKIFPFANIYNEKIINSINEHNFFVVQKYFKTISLNQLSSIINMSVEECVSKICFMVNNNLIDCKIDQRKEMVQFKIPKVEWKESVGCVLNRLVKANYLIHNEIIENEEESQ